MKPISTGLPTMGSDVNEEHDMDRKPVLPVRLKVDALPLLGCNSSFFVLGINIIRILFLDCEFSRHHFGQQQLTKSLYMQRKISPMHH